MTMYPEAERTVRATRAFHTIEPSPSEHVLVTIRCGAGHHVATVYDTPDGPVYRSTPRRHSHGDLDLPDTMKRPTWWFDMLNEAEDDTALPAWCDCGSRQLDRVIVRSWTLGPERKVVID
jgi:hypothetical protein